MNTILPIQELHDSFVSAFESGNEIIIQSPTGSGKSTQIPQWVAVQLNSRSTFKPNKIYVLQPRRLAARLLAKRVAEEMGSHLGEIAGYQIRFENVSSPHTQILFLTEGVFIRKLLADPSLSECAVIIFDEFHERHLDADLALALSKELKNSIRPDLRLIVMSATLDRSPIQNYLSNPIFLESKGRIYPVEIHHIPSTFIPSKHYTIAEFAAEKAVDLLHKHPEGDLLIFMPGVYEIHRTLSALREKLSLQNYVLLPLHGELKGEEQDAAIRSYPQRKVIVATNVAETSITIDGVRLIIDSGLARQARYDAHRGINTLLIEAISQASAEQRAGRAGRTANGYCLRLWTQEEHRHRPAQEVPEIHRVDLAEPLLFLKSLGVKAIEKFPWYQAPKPEACARTMQLLKDLGAIDQNESITAIGKKMVQFPAHPRFSRMILAAAEKRCVRPILTIIALTQTRNILQPLRGREAEMQDEILKDGESISDFFIQMRALRYAQQSQFNPTACGKLGIHASAARHATQIQDQLIRLVQSESIPIESEPVNQEAIARCLLLGFADNLAMRRDGGTLRCRLVHNRSGELSRHSVVKSPLFVASEIREINQEKGGDVTTILSLATAIDSKWIYEEFPHVVRDSQEIFFDSNQRKVMTRIVRSYHDLILEERISDNVPLEEAAKILALKIQEKTLILKNWDDSIEQWICRLNWFSSRHPELNIQPIDDVARLQILETICHGATSYKEIKNTEILPTLKTWLSTEQLIAFETMAPTHLTLPSGKKTKIHYSENCPPRISARIQDLYDLKGSLAIDNVPVTIEILAPNFRPIQITNNPNQFWEDQYPEIKQQLQSKYPKHVWR